MARERGSLAQVSAELAVWLLMGVVLSGAAALSGAPMGVGPSLVTQAVMGLALELGAGRLGAFGFFSMASAAYVGLGLSQPGPAAAMLVALSGLLLRTAWRGRREKAGRLRELLCDLVPIAACLAAFAWVPGSARIGVGLLLGLSLSAFLPQRLARAVDREELLSWYPLAGALAWLRSAPWLAGCGLAALAPSWPWLPVAFFPVLWGCQQVSENLSCRLEVQRTRQVQDQLELSHKALDRVHGAVHQAHKQLAITLDERNVLEDFTRHLASSPDLSSTLDLILSTAARVAPYRSVALFVPDEGGGPRVELVPARFISPNAENLEAAALLKTREPLVDECWERRTILRSTPELRRYIRLFEREKSALALPLQSEGVLYVGREGEELYSEADLQRLATVAGFAALALQSSRRQQAREEALRLHAEAHLRLQQWVDLLSILLGGSRDFATTLDPDHLMEHLERLTLRSLPHVYGCILYQEGEARQWVVEGAQLGVEPDLDSVREIARTVRENRKALLLEDIRNSRFLPPAPLSSWLCVPMLTEEGVSGAICLGAKEPGALTREHQDLLLLLAFQAAVALSNARLFRAVVEARRKLEASQAQLVQSSKMAAVGQLAAGVAHEINSPLGAILLALDAAEARLAKDPASATPKLQRARKAAHRAREIINKLLFYSRQTGAEPSLVDPCQLVEETLEFLSHQLEMDNIEVRRELTPVPGVLVNPNEVQQVVVNLLMNARDAMLALAPERKKIRVFTRADQQAVGISIQDLGEGISPENLQRIFDPFFTTKQVGEGTGLGLSVSMQIVQQYGGRIEVRSQVGQGSTFTILFPANPGSP